MTGPSAPGPVRNDASRDAIARVLQAEKDAAQSIGRSRAAAQLVAEDARSDARRMSDRTEQRIRSVLAAFERELARQLAGIDAEAAALLQPHALTEEELAALDRAVRALAHELTGTPA